MSRALVPLVVSLALPACSPRDIDVYSPSLTMIRVGEVIVEEPPPIPEALWVPGINIKPEDYDYADAKLWELDLSAMEDLEDPEPLEKHASYDYKAGTGDVVDDKDDEGEINYDDVEQGAIGDCFFVAALSATIYIDDEHAIRDGLIRPVTDDDGLATQFVVRFYDAWGDPQDIRVDADLVRKTTKPTYARSLDTTSSHEEWWVSLVEKAYAQWHGGYETIGEGGWAGDVMQALTGSTATYRSLKYMSDSTIYRSVRNNLDANRPVVAGTFGKEDGVDYAGTNIYAWHAYSVLDVREDEGEHFITLRNPWGEVEPAGNGPDDGIFEIGFEEFKRLYEGITLGGGHTVDHVAPDAVTDLSVAEVGADFAVLSFTAPGDDRDEGLAAQYDVRVCDHEFDASEFYDCDAVPMAGPQSPGSDERLTVSGLAEDERAWFAIKVEDESGNISAMSDVVSALPTSPVDDTPAIPFEQFWEFEGGEPEWEGDGLWHITQVQAASGASAWWFGSEDSLDYDTGARVSGTLTSPKLDTTGVASPVVLWEHLLDVESGPGTDKAWLEVSTEDGGFDDWTTVWEKDGTSDYFDLAYVTLDGMSGETIRLRFRFDSMDERDNDGSGWFVDDVWTTSE